MGLELPYSNVLQVPWGIRALCPVPPLISRSPSMMSRQYLFLTPPISHWKLCSVSACCLSRKTFKKFLLDALISLTLSYHKSISAGLGDLFSSLGDSVWRGLTLTWGLPVSKHMEESNSTWLWAGCSHSPPCLQILHATASAHILLTVLGSSPAWHVQVDNVILPSKAIVPPHTC